MVKKEIEMYWDAIKANDTGDDEVINSIKFHYGSIDNYRKSCEATWKAN